MTEQGMIERVARVLCERDIGDPDAVIHPEGAIAGTSHRSWEAFASHVRIILAVMREPTDAMLQAALKEAHANDIEASPSELKAIFTAMITAALKEA